MGESLQDSDFDLISSHSSISCRLAYASDSSFSNLSCSSCSDNSSRRSSLERRSVSISNHRKPHKALDRAWTAIHAVQQREGRLTLSHFKLLRQVGHGDIGDVHLAQLRGTACTFAMKVMDKEALRHRKKIQRMENEREILEYLDHPFLPTLYGHFETENLSCMVMEYCCGGDLHSLRQKRKEKRFGLRAARFYTAEVLMSLEYLHMMGIIYRDLKPENVLVREDGHIMLADFDLSLKCEVKPKVVKNAVKVRKQRLPLFSFRSLFPSYVRHIRIRRLLSCLFSFRKRRPASKRKRASKAPPMYFLPELIAEPTHARSMSFVGTHEYLPPEIIRGDGHGSPVDWWAFGIFLYELLFGRTPFQGQTNKITLLNIINQPLQFPQCADIEVGEAARNLIRGLLAKDPNHRLGATKGAVEIKRHPFFRGFNWALIRSAKPPYIPRKRDRRINMCKIKGDFECF